MLDTIQCKKIWYKLIEQNYQIEKITISTDKFSSIEIIFLNVCDLEKFRQLIFDFMYWDIFTTCNLTQLTLFVKIDLDFFSRMDYPKFTKQLLLFNSIDSENVISLGLLSSVLEKIIIISKVPFDLTNLPNQLVFLDLSGCTGLRKFNFDYLPESLKILKLSYTDGQNKNSIYDLNDLQNLPSSLNEIYIGNKFFCSTKDVLKNYYLS